MGCLVVLLGFLAGFFALVFIVALIQGEFAAGVLVAIIEAVLIILFAVCLKKYRSPEHQAKMKKAQEEWKANAPARKKLREEKQAQRDEAYRQRTTIVATRLIGEKSAEYKKSVGSMAVRGAIGSIFGPAGAAIGMATAKNKNTNKNVRRFLVKYLDGHIEEKEATIGSTQYKEYMKHLEWEE